MTLSLFNALGNLRQVLTTALAAIDAGQAGAALSELRTVPGLRDLSSLENLTEPRRLTALLFHQDRYDAVAARLNLPEDALRGIFGAETRASRLLPAVASVPVEPQLWSNRTLWKNARQTIANATEIVTQDWRAAKVRRIAPRDKEPIGVWTAQRTLLMASTGIITEAFASIEETPDGVKTFSARLGLKIADYQRRMITRGWVENLFRAPLLGTLWTREGMFESRYAGSTPQAGDWQATYIPGNLGLTFQGPVFARKKPEALTAFFDKAVASSVDIIGFLLASSEA